MKDATIEVEVDLEVILGGLFKVSIGPSLNRLAVGAVNETRLRLFTFIKLLTRYQVRLDIKLLM